MSFLKSFINEQKARSSSIAGSYAFITGNWSSRSELLIGGNGLPSIRGFFVPNKNFSRAFAEFSITSYHQEVLSLNETLSSSKLSFFYFGFYCVVVERVTKFRGVPLRNVDNYINFLSEQLECLWIATL